MKSTDFTLRFVAPAFLAGAMSKPSAEDLSHHGVRAEHRLIGPRGDGLRIPSLRGVLRYWFRAKEGDIDMAELHEREGKIFGSTSHGQGLRIAPRPSPVWQPGRIEGGSGGAEAYLGYGPLNYRTDLKKVSSHHKQGCRDAIPAGTAFHFRAFGTEHQLGELKKCLRLLHLFGGLGARSRRGWGSVVAEADWLEAFKPEQGTPDEVRAWYAKVLELVWPEPPERPSTRASGVPSFTAFSALTRVVLTPVLPGGHAAVFGEFFRRFKQTRLWRVPGGAPGLIATTDHNREMRDARALATAVTEIPDRIAFGLPYQPESRTSNWKIVYHGSLPGAAMKDRVSRRASPLFLKAFPLGSGRQIGVALFLESAFFGKPGTEIGAEGGPNTLPFPGYSAVHSYLNDPTWTKVTLP